MLAAAFAFHNTLAPTDELQAIARREPLADVLPRVPELVRPARGTLRVLRELEATSDAAEAASARDAGMNAVLLEPDVEGAFAEPDARGFFVATCIEDVLEIIRIPYTRSVINLRHMFHALLQTPSRSESAS